MSCLGTPFAAATSGGQSCGTESLTCAVCTKSELLGTQLMLENWMIGVEKQCAFHVGKNNTDLRNFF